MTRDFERIEPGSLGRAEYEADYGPPKKEPTNRQRAENLKPEDFKVLAQIILADSIETASALLSRLTGRQIKAQNVRSQLSRARRGGHLREETRASAMELSQALNQAYTQKTDTTVLGWDGFFSLLRIGHSLASAADTAGISQDEIAQAFIEDDKRLKESSREIDTELADCGRRAREAIGYYKTQIYEAGARGEDVKIRLAHLEYQEKNEAWATRSTALNKLEQWNYYLENMVVVESELNLDALNETENHNE